MTERFYYPSDREQSSAAQVRALEALLIEKGVIASTTVDKVLGYFES
jgi:nitrile hydratase